MGNPNVRTLTSVPKLESICGPLFVLSTERDTPAASAALLQAVDWGTLHYHRQTTEFYYVISGQGHVLLGDEVIPVSSGTFLIIPPNTKHQVQAGQERLEILVIATPAWHADDEFEGAPKTGAKKEVYPPMFR